MILVPIEDVEGLLLAIEAFFGPDIFSPMSTTEQKTANLNKFGVNIKFLVDKQRREEAGFNEKDQITDVR